MIIFARREQLNKKCMQGSDVGFSLIELLIAVTILAIIVVPLLRAFVTSTKINVKSRQTLRATTVAQDIMEGLKAYTLEEVSEQFQTPEEEDADAFHDPPDGFYLLDSSLIQGGVRELTQDMPSHAEGDEIYYFGIRNLKMQDGEYDALIRLDASTYGRNSKKIVTRQNGSMKIGNAGGVHDREFNGRFYAEIGSVAETDAGDEETLKTDSSYHENKKLTEAVLKDAREKFEDLITDPGVGGTPGTLPADWDDLWKDMEPEDVITKRLIDVVLEDGGSGQCKATINFTYDCCYQYNGKTYTCMSNGHSGTEAGVAAGINRTFSSGNFYLFYYPIYHSGKQIDYIQFRINDAARLCSEEEPLLKSITLAKQIRSEVDADAGIISPDLSPMELWARESAYKVTVDLSADARPEGELIFRRNVETNLIRNPYDGEWDTIDGVQYPYDAVLAPQIKECDFTGDKAGDNVTNVIYDIEITVYQAGAAEHFTEDHFEDNDEVHRLATLTNTRQ